ncbi:peroxiredoxin [Flavobacterium aquaticum]|uniref:Peroxiredoxin n=1 Tax=Flavobacterium aquaticum TaxID=1236486 RepID=A0A327YQG9_9FLAO|nr:thioredoxin family protein [Flavobacterium aquaticum]RAK22556.1 peroxiredoxin [Flavobacterium aquaticum]
MKRIGFFALLMGVLMSFTNPTGYKVGDMAADFKLKSVDNKMYSMSDYKDAKGFIVVFTCNHCPFAVKYEDRIIDLAKKYKSKGYILLAINPNDPVAQPEDSFELMQKRAKEKKFTFPYLFDEGQKIYPQYGATKTPHVFLLDKNLVVKYIGAIDDNVEDASEVKEKYLENAIAALEKGQEPTPNTTKAIGCSIKVKK